MKVRAEPVIALSPATMPMIASVDERYQSYNIEMIQVMGGKWWAPYPKSSTGGATTAADTAGFGAAPKLYRPPTNLADPRLRTLAAALSPAYVRVTDTWANTVFFQDTNDPAPASPPPGFSAVITSAQWKGVIDFSNTLDAKIVTSFSIAAGVRDAQGVWTPVQAAKILAYTQRSGGHIAAAEFYNEPNLGGISGAPKGYDTQAYARDFKVFHDFIKATDPAIKLFGPGPVGENKPLPGLPAGLKSEDILKAIGPTLDGVSYHYYGALSQRCAGLGAGYQTTPDAALSPEWLMGTTKMATFYGDLRDRYEPGKPVWLTETAETACGGNPWSSDFLDTFRYLNQLGALAKQGVQVVMHNTLAGSDYGLIDDVTLAPRPNYWAAVLWHRLMGNSVLEPTASPKPNLYLYAQCLRGHPGGVALLAINADRATARSLSIPARFTRYTLSARTLLDTSVDMNGKALALTKTGALPALRGKRANAGRVDLTPMTITFLAVSDAGNSQCR